MPRNVIVQTVKAERRQLLRQLKKLDRMLTLAGGSVVRRKRRKVAKKAKAKTATAKAPAPKKASKPKAAPKPKPAAELSATERLALKRKAAKASE